MSPGVKGRRQAGEDNLIDGNHPFQEGKMQPLQKHHIIYFLIVFLPISLLVWIKNGETAFATSSQADQTIFLPLVLQQSEWTDITLKEMITPTTEVVLGDVVEIGIAAENVGNQDVTVDIPVLMTDTTDSLPIGTQFIPELDVAASTTVTFTWDTGSVLRGSNVTLDSSFESGGINEHTLIAMQTLSDDEPMNDSVASWIPITVWEESSFLGYDLILQDADLIHISPHSGEWAVWLAGDSNETASISQLVTVPENNPTLVYWYWIQSAASVFPCDTIFEGTGGVKIDNTAIGQDHRLCGDLDTGWVENRISLSAYAGETVVLTIWAQTPYNVLYGGPSLYIDDVTIESQ
jgi:hypothetical protein